LSSIENIQDSLLHPMEYPQQFLLPCCAARDCWVCTLYGNGKHTITLSRCLRFKQWRAELKLNIC